MTLTAFTWVRRLFKPKWKSRTTIGKGVMAFLKDGPIIPYSPDASSIEEFMEVAADYYENLPPVDPATYAHVKPFVRPETNHCREWMSTALDNEVAFYQILAKYLPIEVWNEVLNLSVWDTFEKYSSGDRYGIWTILDFVKNEDGTFTFEEEDIATLSGSGSERVWKIENGEAVFVKNMGVWMS